MKKKVLSFLFLALILIQFIQILYSQRSNFLNSYDVNYWKDRFEHSQWQLPLSKRIIGDDGLFAYVGYSLIKGEDPTKMNVETPPFGKYLIGISILLFGSPSYYALFLGIGSIILFFLLVDKILKNRLFALIGTTFLFLDPLFFNQFWKAWLDISQLFFLLLNILIFISILEVKKYNTMLSFLLCGISIGLFSQIKFPILLPAILVLESGWILYKTGKKEWLIFLLGFVIAIIISYLRYFTLGYGLIDFLLLQKYILSFYMKSRLITHNEALWQVLIIGKFPDISGGIAKNVAEWSLLWPIITIFGLISALKVIIKKGYSTFLKGIAIFLFIALTIYTIIPVYPRYLMLIMPFLYLFFLYLIKNLKNKHIKVAIFTVMLSYAFFHANKNLIPSYDSRLQNFYYNFSNQYFQDIYQEDIVKLSSSGFSREKFFTIAKSNLDNANIKAIEIHEDDKNISLNENRGFVNVSIVYKTQQLGSFTERKVIPLVKEQGQWKIQWNWGILLNSFSPYFHIESTIIPGKRGTIKDESGRILVQDASGYLIEVRPDIIDRKAENKMLNVISAVSFMKPVHIQNAYLENVIPHKYVPITTIYSFISDDEKRELLSYPGLKLTPYLSRLYDYSISSDTIKNIFYEECCTRIYSSYNYHGISGWEKKYDSVLKGSDGGVILIKDDKGNVIRIILHKQPKQGNDVVVSL